MKPLRIAFLTPEFVRNGQPHGGLANYLSRISRLLKAEGHTPSIFLLGATDSKINETGIKIYETTTSKLNQRYFPGRLKAWDEFTNRWIDARRLAKSFNAEHKKNPFDIVHSTTVSAVGNSLVGQLNIPFVVRASSLSPLWRTARGQKTSFRNHLTDWLEFRQIQHADAVFSPSRLLANHLNQLLGISVSIIRSPYSISSDEEDLTVYQNRLAGKSYLLYFGKINRRKGADVLADALPCLFEKHPSHTPHLQGQRVTIDSYAELFFYHTDILIP